MEQILNFINWLGAINIVLLVLCLYLIFSPPRWDIAILWKEKQELKRKENSNE